MHRSRRSLRGSLQIGSATSSETRFFERPTSTSRTRVKRAPDRNVVDVQAVVEAVPMRYRVRRIVIDVHLTEFEIAGAEGHRRFVQVAVAASFSMANGPPTRVQAGLQPE